MSAPQITSRQNPLVARFRAAADYDDSWMLLDGPHLVTEALAAGVSIDCVAIDAERFSEADRRAFTTRVPPDRVFIVSRAVLHAMSPVRTPTGIVALAARPRHALTDMFGDRTPLVLGAVDVQDPGNLGAMVRAAEAGGARGVVCTAGGADPYGWKVLRGAMGSAFRLPIVRVPSIGEAIGLARAAGLQVIAAVGHGATPLEEVDLRPSSLVLLGSEGQGLSPSVVEAADVRMSIPMAAPVESLNVAVAGGLVVYEARRQRRMQPQSRRHEAKKAR